MTDSGPSLLVWSSLFPSPAQPQAGIFVRERMFRVAEHLPVAVISPQPWFPLQGVLRRLRPHFRPQAPKHERQAGIDVYRPRFLSFPGVLKRFDGLLMALGALPTVRRLVRARRVDVVDAHFAYPDGYAATRVGKWLGLPVTVTLRGTEARHAKDAALRSKVIEVLQNASRVFSVSSSLRQLSIDLGIEADKILVVGNGVDVGRFRPIEAAPAKAALGLPTDARVLITVGGLVERKGFHRVVACLPELLSRFPNVHYLVVGSAGPEGDYSREVESQVRSLGLGEHVHFLGSLPPEGVCRALSAADVFVLSSRNEGWANVLLEAMACGLPVVATDVGGNAEVVCRPDLGRIVPFGDHDALQHALVEALAQSWDRTAIRRYAEQNDWERRVDVLLQEFRQIVAATGSAEPDATHAR